MDLLIPAIPEPLERKIKALSVLTGQSAATLTRGFLDAIESWLNAQLRTELGFEAPQPAHARTYPLADASGFVGGLGDSDDEEHTTVPIPTPTAPTPPPRGSGGMESPLKVPAPKSRTRPVEEPPAPLGGGEAAGEDDPGFVPADMEIDDDEDLYIAAAASNRAQDDDDDVDSEGGVTVTARSQPRGNQEMYETAVSADAAFAQALGLSVDPAVMAPTHREPGRPASLPADVPLHDTSSRGRRAKVGVAR